jgi:thioredoxin 1
MVSPVIEELAEEHIKVTFGKLNVDENSATANRFRIMSIPLILFFKNGKLIDTVVGAVPKSVIEDKIHILQ